MGIHYGIKYFESLKTKWEYLIGYFLLTTLGILSKLPVGYLLIIFLPFLYKTRNEVPKNLYFIVVSIISVCIIAYWYFIWVPKLVNQYGFWHFFMGKSIFIGYNEIMENLNQTFSKFYETALKYVGFFLFIYGLGYAIIKKDYKIIILFVFTTTSFLVIILKAGFTFTHHSYYVIPYVPVMALIAGYGLSTINHKKWATLIILTICVEGILNQQHDFRLRENELSLLNLENDLNKFSSKNDLILINSGAYPTPMYFAHRKGWVAENNKISNQSFVDDLKQKKLKYIVILKRTFGSEIVLPYNTIFENNDYTIYSLL
jgi:hypothetical protein